MNAELAAQGAWVLMGGAALVAAFLFGRHWESSQWVEEDVIELPESAVTLEPIRNGVWYDPAGHFVFSSPFLMAHLEAPGFPEAISQLTSIAVRWQEENRKENLSAA